MMQIDALKLQMITDLESKKIEIYDILKSDKKFYIHEFLIIIFCFCVSVFTSVTAIHGKKKQKEINNLLYIKTEESKKRLEFIKSKKLEKQFLKFSEAKLGHEE